MYHLIPFPCWNYVQEVNTFGNTLTPKKKQNMVQISREFKLISLVLNF